MKRIEKLGLPIVFAGITLVAVAAFLVLGGGATSEVAHAQTAQTPTPGASGSTTRTDIGVTGTGQVYADPDIAIVNLGVDITAATLSDATAQASAAMTKVLDAIKAQGVDAKDIQTSNYSVFPITNQPKDNEPAQITGYHVSNQVTVKVRTVANVGKVIDAAIAAGANSVNGVTFTVEDPSKFMDQARTAAVKQAMATAQTLATAAGVKVGSIVSITDMSNQTVPVFRGAFDSAAVPAAGGAGPVETGQTQIMATVEMHFEIAQ